MLICHPLGIVSSHFLPLCLPPCLPAFIYSKDAQNSASSSDCYSHAFKERLVCIRHYVGCQGCSDNSEVPALEEGTIQGDSPGVGPPTRGLRSLPRPVRKVLSLPFRRERTDTPEVKCCLPSGSLLGPGWTPAFPSRLYSPNTAPPAPRPRPPWLQMDSGHPASSSCLVFLPTPDHVTVPQPVCSRVAPITTIS